MKNKVRTVMKEFKSGDLKSSSGKKVTNPKQAIAIALSEAGKSKSMKEGGHMKESKEMMKKEVSFMKKKGAPKSMIKHEMKEAGMKNGDKVKKMALGGMAAGVASKALGSVKNAVAAKAAPMKMQNLARSAASQTAFKAAPKQFMSDAVKAGTVRKAGVTPPPRGMMKKGGEVKKMAGGGLAPGHKSADGVAKKGKTDTKQVAMKKGGAVKKMRYGGKC
jgi:hypothetical protein